MKAMTIEKAIEALKENYAKGLTNPTVYDPVGWALYKTWRMADKAYRHRTGKTITIKAENIE